MSTGQRPLLIADVEGLLGRYVEGCRVKDLDLYRRAVTHKSFDKTASYERLEFLGDSVLNLVVSAYLFRRYPGENEGFMTRMRTKTVNGAMLSSLCSQGTKLSEFVLRRSPPTEPGPVRRSYDPVMEDVFEAFLGAVFLEFGYATTERWLVGFLEEHVDFAQLVAHQNNAKDVLNRYCVTHHGALPKFEEVEAGGHGERRTQNKTTTVRIRNKGTVIATGVGATRKEAENQAARSALVYYDVPEGDRV
jgi:ribonuclease-3